MRQWLLGSAMLVSVSVAGCATDVIEFASRWLTPEEEATADHTFERASAGDWEAIRSSFHASVEDPGGDQIWNSIGDLLAEADLASRELIGINVSTTSDRRTTRLVYEGPMSDGWYMVTLRIRDGELYGFNVNQNPESLVEANAFGFGTIGVSHLVLLLLGLGSIAVAAVASYRVLKSDIRRRKLWTVLPWVMVGKVSLNWTSGALGLQLISLQVPPITFTKGGPAAPWIFGFGLPVFAWLALRKVKKANEAKQAEPASDPIAKDPADPAG